MKKLLLSLSLIALGALPAFAQHVHSVPHTTTHFDTYRHGNHTHTVPHTTTHYDNVWHNGPDYVPHTTTHYDTYLHGNHTHTVPHTTTHLDPVYPSGIGSGVLYPSQAPIYNPPLATPSVIVTAPPPATVVPGYGSSKPVLGVNTIPSAANVIPGRASIATGAGRSIVLTNPSDTGGDIRYSVNEFSYTISPGQSQTLNLDRDWMIKFDNGLGRQVAYKLAPGKYHFSVSEAKGWDVGRIQDEVAAPAPPVAPAVEFATSSNSIPK